MTTLEDLLPESIRKTREIYEHGVQPKPRESHYCIDCNDAHDPATCGAFGPRLPEDCFYCHGNGVQQNGLECPLGCSATQPGDEHA